MQSLNKLDMGDEMNKKGYALMVTLVTIVILTIASTIIIKNVNNERITLENLERRTQRTYLAESAVEEGLASVVQTIDAGLDIKKVQGYPENIDTLYYIPLLYDGAEKSIFKDSKEFGTISFNLYYIWDDSDNDGIIDEDKIGKSRSDIPFIINVKNKAGVLEYIRLYDYYDGNVFFLIGEGRLDGSDTPYKIQIKFRINTSSKGVESYEILEYRRII